MKVLFVGLGSIGQRHVRNLRRLLGSEIAIAAYRVRRVAPLLTDDMRVDPRGGIEERHGIEAFDELDRALAWKPDAVFVCNPNSMHMPVALAAAQAGCDLFVEKPLSHNLEGVAELLDRVDRRQLVAMCGYQLRFHPCFLRLQELLAVRSIGRVLAVRCENGEYMPGWHPYEDYRTAYATKTSGGGGVILCQIHDLDYLYALFGLPRRVFALGGRLSNLEIEVEDVASLAMEFECDGRGVPVHLHMDFIQRPPSRTCAIVGESGKILVDWRAASLWRYDAAGNEVERLALPDFARNQMFLDELSHFLLCRKTRQTPLVSLRDGAQSLRIALAAKESLASGRVVAPEGVAHGGK